MTNKALAGWARQIEQNAQQSLSTLHNWLNSSPNLSNAEVAMVESVLDYGANRVAAVDGWRQKNGPTRLKTLLRQLKEATVAADAMSQDMAQTGRLGVNTLLQIDPSFLQVVQTVATATQAVSQVQYTGGGPPVTQQAAARPQVLPSLSSAAQQAQQPPPSTGGTITPAPGTGATPAPNPTNMGGGSQPAGGGGNQPPHVDPDSSTDDGSSSATVTTTGGGSTPDPETTGGGSGGGGGGSNGVAQGNSKPQPNNNSNPPSATQPSGTTPTGGGPNITDRQERVVRIIGGERPIGYLGGHVDPYTNSDGGGGGEVGPAPGHGPTPTTRSNTRIRRKAIVRGAAATFWVERRRRHRRRQSDSLWRSRQRGLERRWFAGRQLELRRRPRRAAPDGS